MNTNLDLELLKKTDHDLALARSKLLVAWGAFGIAHLGGTADEQIQTLEDKDDAEQAFADAVTANREALEAVIPPDC